MLIRKLQKFTIQTVSLHAAIEENAAKEENAAFYCGSSIVAAAVACRKAAEALPKASPK